MKTNGKVALTPWLGVGLALLAALLLSAAPAMAQEEGGAAGQETAAADPGEAGQQPAAPAGGPQADQPQDQTAPASAEADAQPEEKEEGQEGQPDQARPGREDDKLTAGQDAAMLGVMVARPFDEREVRVLRVRPDSPAAKAGIRAGDVIRSVDGQEIGTPEGLRGIVSGKKAGDRVEVILSRDGEEKTVTATLSARDDAVAAERTERRARDRDESRERRDQAREDRAGDREERAAQRRAEGDDRRPVAWLGVALEAADRGVRIADVEEDSPAAKAGLRPGDYIVRLDGDRVEEPADVLSTVRGMEPGEKVAIVVRRDGRERTLNVELGAHADAEDVVGQWDWVPGEKLLGRERAEELLEQLADERTVRELLRNLPDVSDLLAEQARAGERYAELQKRHDALEKEVDSLRKELEALRREMTAARAGQGAAPPQP